MTTIHTVKSLIMSLGAAALLTGCLNAGVHNAGLNDGAGGERGFVTPQRMSTREDAVCAIFSFPCVPVLAEENIRALFPRKDPKDGSDPVRSTRDDIAQCRARYEQSEGRAAQWDDLEKCENGSFQRWASGGPMRPAMVQAVLAQNHWLLSQAQQGVLTPKEAWLQWRVVMEMSALDIPDPARANSRINKDWLKEWQDNQCTSYYDGSKAPTPHYKALCHNAAYVAWARRAGGYIVSDLTPVLKINLTLADEQQRTGHFDAKAANVRLWEAQAQAEQLKERHTSWDGPLAFDQKDVQEGRASSDRNRELRDEALATCSSERSYGARAQCVDKAWYDWAATVGIEPERVREVIQMHDHAVQQREPGKSSNIQAPLSAGFACHVVGSSVECLPH